MMVALSFLFFFGMPIFSCLSHWPLATASFGVLLLQALTKVKAWSKRKKKRKKKWASLSFFLAFFILPKSTTKKL
ncbi:hypothetical protein GMOD_00010340 [Pyrenophora seminiperda CCB06]|uniref:Uncharacterized protein n=1 Tax=Pyrenophora seminiperda CCB06 TaxID=1302712 RepID=A0A3M7M5B8_9PLEO|nr:hypothetical protein GMOD_00010340 [Pyrenophora seminiperda CCB06]